MAVTDEKAALVSLPNPYTTAGRGLTFAEFLPRETLGQFIARTGAVVPDGPIVAWHNGHRCPDHLWRQLIPRSGDQIIIRARAMGGGGDSSKILRSVALIALALSAPYLGGLLAESAFGTALGMSAGFASAAIMIGGSLAITALLPIPKPTASQLTSGSKYESSPTYSISGGRNRMRPWEPMTLIFGRHKVVPDAGGKPYTEWVGDTQYLNQVFHFGLQWGSVGVDNYKIGDTPIGNYQGVQLQLSGPDGKLSMFPGNVDTLQGFLLASGVVNSRTTPADTNYISVELASQLFYVRDDGGMDARSVDLRIQYRNLAGGGWTDIGMLNDAIYATHYWSAVESGTGRQYSYGSTNYADHTAGERTIVGYEKRYTGGNEWPDTVSTVDEPIYGYWDWVPHPHSMGQPWQGRAPDPLLGHSSTPGIRMSGAKQEPTRQTVGWAVPQGQYEIQVWKTTGDIKNSRESNETGVGQILCYQPDTADYTGQIRLAMRIKATAQLNGPVDELSAICTQWASVWNGSTWVWAPTRNPAWIFISFAHGAYDAATGNRIWGGGMTGAQIDYEAIKAWGLWCDQKGLTFDYVLDRKMSSAEVLQIIARAGRASPTWQTGKLGVVWDAADLPVVAMFGPFNIKAGSFKIDYINDGTADEIVLNYANSARGYQMDEVRVRVPGATTTNNPLQLDFEGCTETAMAGREANLLAASQVWHRRRVSWETDIEGWVAGRGDVAQISHDLTVWGYSGRVTSRAGNVLTLDKAIPSDGSGTMMIRDPENQMKVVSVTSGVGDVNTLTITSDMTGFPLPGDSGYEDVPNVDWAWFFDPLETPGRRFKITEVHPSEDGVKFSAIDDDPGYYASENNPYIYAPPRDGALLSGVIFGVEFTEQYLSVAADSHSVTAFWSSSTRDTNVQVIVSVNGAPRPAITTTGRSIDVTAKTDDVIRLAVTPIPANGARGATFQSAPYTVVGLRAPLPTVTGFNNVFRDGLTALVWQPVSDFRNPNYEIRMGPSWINSRTVAVTTGLDILAVGNGLYWVAARFPFRNGALYGEPDSLNISGATLVRNVIETTVEAPDWTGTVDDGAIINEGLLTLAGTGDFLTVPDVLAMDDVLWYGGVISGGTYQTASGNVIDIGFATPVRVDFHLEEYALNFGENFLTIPDVLSYADVLNVSNRQRYKVRPQIRHAQDDGVFTEWRDYVPGLINARYFDVRLLLETDDALLVPFVETFTWSVDVPDLLQMGANVTVPVDGLRITYPTSFHNQPVPNLTWLDALDGDRYVLTNSDLTGFDIQMMNGTTPVSRVINWISQRY